jgi:hypothetical protein
VLQVAALPGARVTVGYRLMAASGDHVEARYGVNPEHLTDFALPNLRFTVAVRDAKEMREVMDAEVPPVAARLDGRMREASIDLSPWAGHAIEILLGVTASAAGPMDLAGWGTPRVVESAR